MIWFSVWKCDALEYNSRYCILSPTLVDDISYNESYLVTIKQAFDLLELEHEMIGLLYEQQGHQ